MKRVSRFACICMTLLLLLSLLPCALAAGEGTRETTVLFTHDLHSHFLPQVGEDGGQSGGYARLAWALAREKQSHPQALVLDGGDFSIGSLLQTLYVSHAAELRTMGAMGYDAATIGNHEFDHRGTGFAQMLTAAKNSGAVLPALVQANYKPGDDNPHRLEIQRAMAGCGVKDYILLERDGVTYGIFGLMGQDSHECAPTSGFQLEDPIQAARRCVQALEEQGAEFIICLSHSGTDEKLKKSEDEQLAKKVDGIDLIVSGHTHTTLNEPLLVNGTYIVSAGPYCRNLGSITLSWDAQGNKTLQDYHLTPIDGSCGEDGQIAELVKSWKDLVSIHYLGPYGLKFDQVLTRGSFDLNTPLSGVQEGNALGELVSDAFRWTLEQVEAQRGESYTPTVAVTADGVLRADLLRGPITAAQAFDVLSMGVGNDDRSGFPLVTCYLTGKELRAALEVDASVTPIMPAAQLYFSGVHYSFNTHRMFFNRVMSARLDELGAIENDRLYRVVTGMYSAQMLGTVKGKSMGLLSLEPKMADGSPVTDFNQCIVYDREGNEVKEWYALAAYLSHFGSQGIPASYAAPDGRKLVSRSWSPLQLLINPSLTTLAAVAALLLLLAVAVLLIRTLRSRSQRRRYGVGRRRYRG